MSSMQINACSSHAKFRSISSSSQSCYLPAPQLHNSLTHVFQLPKTRLRSVDNAPSYQRCTPVCLFGGKGKSENDNEASPWKALEKAMGGLRKESSVQDLLRKQMQELEFDDDGGSGNRPSGGGGDGSGDSEDDESFAGMLDEVLQVILAIMGFVFLYIYIIRGEEMTRLAKDYIWYLFGAKKSVRLRRAMYKWGKFYKTVSRKRVRDKFWLERAIVNTPTWWYDPRRLRRMLRQAQVLRGNISLCKSLWSNVRILWDVRTPCVQASSEQVQSTLSFTWFGLCTAHSFTLLNLCRLVSPDARFCLSRFSHSRYPLSSAPS